MGTYKRKFKPYTKFWLPLAKAIYPHRDVVYEIEPPEDETAVYICNHSGAIGPATMAMYFDRPARPWIIHYMFKKDTLHNFIFHNFLFGRASKHKFLMRWIVGDFITQALPPLLKDFDPIIVHMNSTKIVATFKESVKALLNGQNIYIFGESWEKFSRFINHLQDGYVYIAKMLYKQTGKLLKFYPLYTGNKLKTINVGAPIEFDPNNDFEAEKKRISSYLENKITEIGESLPEHDPVPFVTDDFYKYYGELAKDPEKYWNFCDQKYSE